ncbi:MAG: ankyrin repeat domain-containing protein [Oleispira sp.]|nr:ankyrin repeat domain-containing protein [Oleispira sp.]
MGNNIKTLALSMLLVFTVTGCFKRMPDSPQITETDKTITGKGFIYPKADQKWDNYIGLYQKDAASFASRKEYWPDDNTFTYLRSYAGVYSRDEYLGYIWRWVSGGRDIVFLSGMIDDAGITNIIVNNKNNLTIDEIIVSFTADEDLVLLGEYGVDYHINAWTDYSTEAKYNLDSSITYPLVKENDVVDLLTYTDYLNCEEIYWINGKLRGAYSEKFKTALLNLTASIDGNDIGSFVKQLPEVLNMECSYYFEGKLQEIFSKYERGSNKSVDEIPESRGAFLEQILKISRSNTFGGRTICEVVNKNIYKKSKYDHHESIVLAELVLNNTDTSNIQCGLSRAIESASQINNLGFLKRLIDIEASNAPSASSENKQDLQRTLLYALESATEVGNSASVSLLSEYLSEDEISKNSSNNIMIAAGEGGSVDVLNLLLKLKLNIDFSENEILEVSLKKGNIQFVRKLFDIGFKLPTYGHTMESFIWSAFKYDKYYPEKDSEKLLSLLIEQGLEFSALEERYRFILMSRVYAFAHTAWVDSSSQINNFDEAERYKRSVIALTNIYMANASSIDFQAGRENTTLLMNAVEGNLPEVVELILEHKPNLSLKNESGKTALDLATDEAKIYILGSRKGFKKVYKINAAKIVSLLGGDITPFKGKIN